MNSPRKVLLITLFLLFDIAYGFAEDPEELALVTNDFPPYSYKQDGQWSGIAADIVTALMKQAAFKGRIEMLPWKRAVIYSLEGKKMMLFPFTRRPFREKKYKWIGPIGSDSFVFAVPGEDKRIYTSIEDFRNMQIGVNGSTPTAARLQALGFKNLQVVTSEKLNANKLIGLNRIDAWYSTYLILKHTVKSLNIDESKIRIIFWDIRVDMYIAATLSVPDETVSRWQNNLDAMKADGRYQMIMQKSERVWGELQDENGGHPSALMNVP